MIARLSLSVTRADFELQQEAGIDHRPGPTARRLSLGWQDARFGAMFALHGRGRQLAYPYRRIHNNRGVNDAHQISPP